MALARFLKTSSRRLKEYRENAAKRGLEWALTSEQFFSIISKPCHYCGCLPVRARYYIRGRARLSKERFNGIDRVNPLIGYVKGNCVPCCAQCNYAKQSLSLREFIAKLRQILKHWDGKNEQRKKTKAA